jgi:mannose-1-phosphate guanylyltransferase/mannose-6-phosphate isomerase
MNIQPVVLAGGSGSRLWPISREIYPKQLLQLTGDKSLLQITMERVARLHGMLPPIVVVGMEHRLASKKQIDELALFERYSILLEPLGRSTAPAICGTTEYVRLLSGEDTILLVLPSDHLISREDDFFDAVAKACKLAAAGRIVTFGIKPERVETGYGYIEKGDNDSILSFREKPGIELVRKCVEQGGWYWNSGMFAFTAATFQKEIDRYAPEMQKCMVEAIKNGRQDGDFFCFDADSMSDVENISIDYILMEKTECAAVVVADFSWKDVGSWQALWEIMEHDAQGNVQKGDVVLHATQNSLVVSGDRLVAAVGLRDTVVVETADSVLVSSMSAGQEVKKVVEYLRRLDRDEFRFHRRMERPWGSITTLEAKPYYKINRVTLHCRSGMGMQKHYHRHEHWVVVSGTARITSGKDVFLLQENQSSSIPAGVVHRLENPGAIPLELIEIQMGSYLGEDDVVSYQAEYGDGVENDESN